MDGDEQGSTPRWGRAHMGTTEQREQQAWDNCEHSLQVLLRELGAAVLALDTAERVLCGDDLSEAA